MTALRTQEEIATRIEEQKKIPLSFQDEVLIEFLDYEHAKPFLKDGVSTEEWAELAAALERDVVIERMRDYWDFALGKALDHRGLSANRSIDKMEAWTWLIGEDDVIRGDYAQYGAPILKQVGERYGFPIPDDEAFTRMANGQRCRDDCMDGCGT